MILDEEQYLKELEHAHQMVREWQATVATLKQPETLRLIGQAQRDVEETGFGEFPIVENPDTREALKQQKESATRAGDALDNAIRVLRLAEEAAQEGVVPSEKVEDLRQIHDRWMNVFRALLYQ